MHSTEVIVEITDDTTDEYRPYAKTMPFLYMELYPDFGSKDGYDMFYNHKHYVKMIFNCYNSKKFYSLVKITQFKSQGNQPQRDGSTVRNSCCYSEKSSANKGPTMIPTYLLF